MRTLSRFIGWLRGDAPVWFQEFDRHFHSFKESTMSALSDLQDQVAATAGAEQSAITLLDGLKAQLDQIIANNDTAALIALRDSLGTSASDLAAAIVRDTPPGDTPPPPPAP